jgi:hypothetical protein
MEYIMKTIIAAAFIGLLSAPVAAQHHYGMRHFDHHQHYRGGGWGWVAPAVIGGAVVYGITRPAPVVVQQPVYIQQPPVVVQPQVVVIDGVEYTKQTMIVNGVAQEVLIRQQ